MLIGQTVRAQTPTWQQTITTRNGTTTVQALATDTVGNLYLTGWFNGTVTFGSKMVTSKGVDTFVAKWSPATNGAPAGFQWVQTAASDYHVDMRATAIAVSGNNVYIAGTYYGHNLTFGSQQIAGPSNGGGRDAFLAKYTDRGATGAFGWAKAIGGPADDGAMALAAAGPNVYMGGVYFGSGVAFPPLATTPSPVSSPDNGYIVKLQDNGTTGTFIWLQQTATRGTTLVSALAVSGSSLYATGRFSGNGYIGTTPVVDGGTFVAKLLDAGSTSSFSWVQTAGNSAPGGVSALAVNGTNVYITGIFSGTASFGSSVLTNANNRSFIAKLVDTGTTGTFAWARGAGGPDYQALGIAVSGTAVYVAGPASGSATYRDAFLTVSGSRDIFVTKCIDGGTSASQAWSIQASGSGLALYNRAYAIAAQGASVYVAGTTDSNGGLLFGPYATVLGAGYVAILRDNALLAVQDPARLSNLAVYPNPTLSGSTFSYRLSSAARINVEVLDALGRSVAQLAVEKQQVAGIHTLAVPALASGLYTVRLQCDGSSSYCHLQIQ
jgi:hypothetical protein